MSEQREEQLESALLALAEKAGEVATLSARVAELEDALVPFAQFGADNVSEDGWNSNIHREGISVWFSSRDFLRAAALTQGESK